MLEAKLKTDNAYRSEPIAPGPFVTMKALSVRHSLGHSTYQIHWLLKQYVQILNTY